MTFQANSRPGVVMDRACPRAPPALQHHTETDRRDLGRHPGTRSRAARQDQQAHPRRTYEAGCGEAKPPRPARAAYQPPPARESNRRDQLPADRRDETPHPPPHAAAATLEAKGRRSRFARQGASAAVPRRTGPGVWAVPGSNGRPPAVRREHLLRSTAVCRSGRTVSDESRHAAALCCGSVASTALPRAERRRRSADWRKA
jgi:hypothetical protein